MNLPIKMDDKKDSTIVSSGYDTILPQLRMFNFTGIVYAKAW